MQPRDRDLGLPSELAYRGAREAAESHFGTGWVWQVCDAGALCVASTPNGTQLLVSRQRALSVCDLWEHAYDLDDQDNRGKFVQLPDSEQTWRPPPLHSR